MDSDDEQVGRVLSRREVLAVLGLSGAALLTTGLALPTGVARGSAGHPALRAGLPSCVVRPEQTEGPFFVDRVLERADLRADPISGRVAEGVPLDLTIDVSSVGSGGCSPLSGAQVDLWQCDARGIYSGVDDRGGSAEREMFLRGFQRTDEAGRVRFTTIYPGWYRGRAVHIHFKVRTDPQASRGQEFVSQLYFDDALTDRVHALHPYDARGPRDRRNSADGLFRRGGDQLMLSLKNAAGSGYAASFDIGLQL